MLKGTLLQNNLFLTPQLVLMDFETAARNALKAVCPQMTLKACCFHFTLCIWRVVWLDWNGTLNVEICDFIAILIIVKVVTLCLFDLNVAQYADIGYLHLE
jgi:hypothetical protein